MQNIQFHLIDHCLPDYFRGHHLPVIQLPVYSNMTTKQVLDGILSELAQCFELYECYTDEMTKQAADNWRKLYDMRKTFVRINKDDKKALQSDFAEPAYLYFVCGVIKDCPPFSEINLPETNETNFA